MRKEALLCLSLMLTQSYAFGSSEVDNTLKQAEVHVLAQKGYIVKGIVKDQLGEPLGGVSIVVKGTTVGTTTDLDGNFTLNVPANNVTLAFSFIGFKSQEVALKGQTDLNIVLSEDTEMLDEVVVVGYGSMKRSDVATAISSVKPEDMNLAGANSRDVRQLLDCDKLIKGEGGAAHGTMELDKDLVSTYSKDNSTDSKEHILSLTYDYLASGLYCGWSGDFYHFNQKYINGGIANGNDGIVVIPSAYDAFADNDLRKKEWMLIGPQYDYKTGEPVVGTSEYSGQPLVFVKDIKRFSEGKTDESTMYTGEENSGARFDKYKTGASGDPNYWGNDWVLYRLTEIYFDKAEALMRKNGGKATQDAVDLINACRQRAFSAEDWENAKYSVATLTMDELLAERGREFIFEGKRRTDLIRFDKFGTGDWWDGKNSDEHYEIFPIPYQQATLNPNLDQNPGYNQ